MRVTSISSFDDDRQAMLERASAKGIGRFIIAGVSCVGWPRQRRVASAYLACNARWATSRLLSQLDETAVLEQLSRIESLLSELGEDEAPIAIGETGIDRVQAPKSTVPLQLLSLNRHLDWAACYSCLSCFIVFGGTDFCSTS